MRKGFGARAASVGGLAYWVTAEQNGQTTYSAGISLPQLGHALSPPPAAGAGGIAAPVAPAAATAPAAGGGEGGAPPGGGGGGGTVLPAAAAAAGAAATPPAPGGAPGPPPGGGAVMPAREVPVPCWSFHWLNEVYVGWRFHQSQNAPSL